VTPMLWVVLGLVAVFLPGGHPPRAPRRVPAAVPVTAHEFGGGDPRDHRHRDNVPPPKPHHPPAPRRRRPLLGRHLQPRVPRVAAVRRAPTASASLAAYWEAAHAPGPRGRALPRRHPTRPGEIMTNTKRDPAPGRRRRDVPRRRRSSDLSPTATSSAPPCLRPRRHRSRPVAGHDVRGPPEGRIVKRPCESCLKRAATRRLVVKGVTFLVCSTCAPAPARRRRAA
jgi:hypothetical protein